MRRPTTAAVLAPVLALVVALPGTACGSDDGASGGTSDAAGTAAAGAGIRLVSPDEGAAILTDPPADLVVLDVRTAEEFDEGHLAGATMLDLSAPDFADRLAELDRDVPYLLYCQSGNRSGQARRMMEQLGFSDVADIEGGIVAWVGAGLPVEG